MLVAVGGGVRTPQQVADDAAAVQASRSAWLLQHLPAASRVLEIGGDGTLERDYRARHSNCSWHRSSAAALPARPHEPKADLIMLADDLRRCGDPLALLRRLVDHAAADAKLWVDVPNVGSASLLRAIVENDLSAADDESAAWPPGALQHHDPASLYKLFLDAGWTPTLVAAAPAAAAKPAFEQAAAALAETLGVPPVTLLRRLRIDRMLVAAHRTFEPPPAPAPTGRFCVVVPTTRERQLRLNVELSPGLREVDARIVSCRGASDPGQALATALPQCDAEWVLLCHQDVYFPSGFGARLQSMLADIPTAERDRTLIGFAGMAVDPAAQGYAPAGFVIDRLHGFDHPSSERAVSIDELGLVVSRRSIHRIDPQFGWHLWATDLCLAAIHEHRMFARVVRLPLFHNSLNDHHLPAAFYDSAQRLAAKYSEFGPIPTLCGRIDEAFLARR